MKTIRAFLLAFALLISGAVLSENHLRGGVVPLQVASTGIDPTGSEGGYERSPMRPPVISLDGHTLLLNVGYDLTLALLDEDGEAVYTIFVPAGTSAVMLPATLSGDYEIQLYPEGSGYYFFGWVEL